MKKKIWHFYCCDIRARQITATSSIITHKFDFTLLVLLHFLGQLHSPSPCANIDSGHKALPHTCPGAAQRKALPPARSPQLTASLEMATSSNLGMECSKTRTTKRCTEPPARTHQPFLSASLIRQTAKHDYSWDGQISLLLVVMDCWLSCP